MRKPVGRNLVGRILSGRTLFGAVAVMALVSTAAFAAQTEGLIKKIDRNSLTITLDDGKTYKMNAETDIDSLKEGMDIVIAYDVTNGENVITDMELPDAESAD